MKQKVILVTGASSGIGLATVERLVEDGHTVYGGARKPEGLARIEKAGGKGLIMEMTEHETLKQAVQTVLDNEGRIDVLFNNAGYGCYGAVEDVPIADARHQFEVNLFGLAKITQEVLPYMRTRGSGTIINTSSMGGKMYTPFGAWYHATKHALEGWSDCLRLELKEFGIDVVVIEPGMIETNFMEVMMRPLIIRSEGGAYEATVRRMQEKTNAGEFKASPASVIAQEVSKAVTAERPKTRYVAGNMAKSMMWVRKYLGDRIFDRMVMNMIK